MAQVTRSNQSVAINKVGSLAQLIGNVSQYFQHEASNPANRPTLQSYYTKLATVLGNCATELQVLLEGKLSDV